VAPDHVSDPLIGAVLPKGESWFRWNVLEGSAASAWLLKT
jgi:hypothetical protein